MATAKDCLDFPLKAELPEPSRKILAEQLWPSQQAVLSTPSTQNYAYVESFLKFYFEYYKLQCTLIGLYQNESGAITSIDTHRDVVLIAQQITNSVPHATIREILCDILKSTDEARHEMSINLVSRLLLMIRIGNVPHELATHTGTLVWTAGGLNTYVHGHFQRRPFLAERSRERMKLEKQFNAFSLQRIAGVEIRWTDNLAEHLKMTNDDRAVAIFNYASFLKHQEFK
jgi:hypothetical protein